MLQPLLPSFLSELEKIAADGDLVLYHGTKPSLIPKILKEGLNPEMMGTGWEGAPTEREGKATSLSSLRHHAAAYSGLGARSDGTGFLSSLFGKHPVLEIRIPKNSVLLKTIKQQIAGDGRGGFDEWHSSKVIPPRFIKKLSSVQERPEFPKSVRERFSITSWGDFEEALKRPAFQRKALASTEDPRLKSYIENLSLLHNSKQTKATIGSFANPAKEFEIKKLRNGRFGCSCNDWRYVRSVNGTDCKHIKRYKEHVGAT